MSARITNHAAKRILKRGLSAEAVIKHADDAIAAGMVPVDHATKIQFGNTILVLKNGVVLTAYSARTRKKLPASHMRKANKRPYDRAALRREDRQVSP